MTDDQCDRRLHIVTKWTYTTQKKIKLNCLKP